MNKRPPRNGEIIEKTKYTLLVDGNALFKTSFFGAKSVYNSNNQHVGGILQFITVLRMILEKDLYHRVYVFWDGNFSGKLRYDIYKDYKIGRGKDFINGTQPIDQSELNQRIRVWEYLSEFYVRQLKNEVVEGDDFIAYYCKYKAKNEKITIITNDTDFSQLISNDIRIYFLHLKDFVDLTNFSSYFCYNQSNSALIKILVGDTADSIKGIKGLGLKTLVTLFPELKERSVTIEEILDHAKQLIEFRVLEKLKPLKVLDNIVNRVTIGLQGTEIYSINKILVDLTNPLMTEEAISDLKFLINGTLVGTDRVIGRVSSYLKEDGINEIIGEFRLQEYLTPFKKLIVREENNYNNI